LLPALHLAGGELAAGGDVVATLVVMLVVSSALSGWRTHKGTNCATSTSHFQTATADYLREREDTTMRDSRRRISQRQVRSLDLVTLLVITVLVSLLVGCGAAPMRSSTATTSSPAPTATSAKINGATSQGCASGQSSAGDASFKPDVVVTQDAQVAGTTQPITLSLGQRLEIRLQSMFNWEQMAPDASIVLASAGAQGWYDASRNACVWRFTAVSMGDVTLTFDGVIVCPPLKLCPSMEQSVAYRVTVQ
jgi:hypothetical protein